MTQENPPGTYILILELPDSHTVEVGSLGAVIFEKGYYLYVGSALVGLRTRLQRHLRANKRLHWHIDYLLPYGRIREIWYHRGSKRHECAWADALQRMSGTEPSRVPFGASDCDCHTHLFCSETFPRLKAFESKLKEKVTIRKRNIPPGDSTTDVCP